MRRIDRNNIIVECDANMPEFKITEVCLIVNHITAIESINDSSCWVYMSGQNAFKAHVSMEALVEFIR